MIGKKTSRRSFIAGTAVLGAAAGLAAPAIAQGKRTLKMVTTWPKNLPGLGMAAENVAKRINEATDGQITIRVYAAGELVGAFDVFDAVSSGNADMYHGAEYYWQGKSAAFNFFSAVPFGLTSNEMNAWIYYGGGQELWDELSAKFNLKPFLCANTGVQWGGWFNKEINNIEDFKGLKIRMPGLGGEVLRRLGASVVSIPGGEIYTSLQQGVIDATEWVGPWNDMIFGFHKIAKYYYWPGFHEPGSALALSINMDVWNSLSKSQQAIIRDACAAQNDVTLAEFNANNATALATLLESHKVELRRFSDEVLTKMGAVSGEVMRETAKADDITRRTYESYLASRKNSMRLSQYSEEAFWQARRLPFVYE
ncbi:MAG: TRAP transporter substrate-binding protein [Alphaproteobacteria bacterium]|nr:TRAP transporter substrate-binding protein [Alphaproteobacteria bacterium]